MSSRIIVQHHGGNSQISKEDGNALCKKKDGLYVSATGIQISQKEGNAIKTESDGLFVSSSTEFNIGDGLILSSDGDIALNFEMIEETGDIDFSALGDDFNTTPAISDVEEETENIDFDNELEDTSGGN